MPITVDGHTYYRTTEACGMAGISRATLLRWLREGVIHDVPIKDRRGWRLFAEDDISRIKAEANKTSPLVTEEHGGKEMMAARLGCVDRTSAGHVGRFEEEQTNETG